MKSLSLTLLTIFVASLQISACTTAIISGKGTADGRPLLYKHRDTNALQNKLMTFTDGKYSYIGIVNSSDKDGKEVWGGYNSAGFAIMNSASYNLNDTEAGIEEREGIIMKQALQQCATLADFEKLLESLPKPLYVNANFGVIDAQGGAAYYETGDYTFRKFDANDPAAAPMGYIVRTNFSFSGDRARDKGLSRYQAAEPLFYNASLSGSLSYRFLLQDVSRHLTHGLTGTNLYDIMPQDTVKPVFAAFRDYIPRYSTSSVIVVQGIKDKEPVSLTTMWTILGSPLTTMAVPVWLNADNIYPSVLFADKTGNAKICNWSLELKKRLFPITRGEGNDYINVAALITKDKKGILQKILSVEDRVLTNTEITLNKKRNNELGAPELKRTCEWIDDMVKDTYFHEFSIQ
ncbi:hypothetical protein D0T84_21840 [Dysgonomonas sp. 521]|uniref:hypothetical protein n=1 Tax=Dysgonomonas sp. 521 TaxID=2302932 RepID=UPI0013D4A244|nr:hypothetical protein [Dysgonomonas sp. 521]NDV97512.1 hypothetical protein [Dysgonomonas sp. 521]